MKYVKLFFSYRARQFEKHGFEKNAFKVFSSKNGGRTWRDKKIHDFHIFSNSGLKFYMRISECICNRIMMKKKYRFFGPFTGEAPLKFWRALGYSKIDEPGWFKSNIKAFFYFPVEQKLNLKLNKIKSKRNLVKKKLWLLKLKIVKYYVLQRIDNKVLQAPIGINLKSINFFYFQNLIAIPFSRRNYQQSN